MPGAATLDYGTEHPAASVKDFPGADLRILKKLSQQQRDSYGMHRERSKETVRRVVELLDEHDINHLRQIHAILGK